MSRITDIDYPMNLLNAVAKGEWEGEVPPDINGTVAYLLAEFSDRQRQIIAMRYEQGISYEKIADVFCVTGERVRQLEEKTLRFLRAPKRIAFLQKGIAGYISDCKTLAAQNAMNEQMDVAIQTLNIITDRLSTITGDEKIGELEKIAMNTRLETPIEDLDLSVRSYNCLKRANVRTVGAILKCDLDNVRNLGKKSILEIERKLTELGVKRESYIPECEQSQAAESDNRDTMSTNTTLSDTTSRR